MENKTKHVSMYEITKMAHEGKDDFERQIEYEKWVKQKQELEEAIIKDMLQNIDNQVAEKVKEKYKDVSQEKETYLDLPMRVCMLYGVMHLHGIGEEDEIMYTLHLATDVNTGNLSIQYKGEDGSFLSHKKVIKAIKKENNL